MKKIFGIALIVIGLLILVTPFTPGSILLVIGIDMVFGDRWPWWNETKKDLRGLWERFLKYLRRS